TLHEVAPFAPARVRVRRTVLVGGKPTVRLVWVTTSAPTVVIEPGRLGPLGPCYPLGSKIPSVQASFWTDYERTATALQTLAHESIHLGGVVGFQLPNGGAAGDPLAEAKAQCYGMQWLPYVAEQLGDTPDDALAIATYYWEVVYPRYRGTQYWSADCS